MKPLQTLTLALLLLPLLSTAQGNTGPVKLPAILPPGPEGATLIKASQLSVGLYTGVANVGIPLHQISMKRFSLPIGLQYAGNGLKVDEIPGRTGLGWALQAGGMVTRSVRGLPDDQSLTLAEPANLMDNTQAVLNYMNQVTAEGSNYDTQPDEYNYSAAGISGKFIIKNGTVHQLPYSKVKISVISSGGGISRFDITDMSGITYSFGNDAIEVTNSYSLSGKYINKEHVKTTWFLKKISDPSGEEIKFYYSPVTIQTDPGITISGSKNLNPPACGDPQTCPTGAMMLLTVNSVSYNTYYLSSISATNGAQVYFEYENRNDQSGDLRLKWLTAYKNTSFLKKYRFKYTDPPATGNYPGNCSFATYVPIIPKCKRFFLTSILDNDPTDAEPPLEYQFQYTDLDSLPHRLSYAQDYYGFYNGASNQGLIPNDPGYAGWGLCANADRKPNPRFAQKGMLQKISYPTGGHQEFVYEPNDGPYNGIGSGLRVKELRHYDPVSLKTTAQYYKYSPGTQLFAMPYTQEYPRQVVCQATGQSMPCNSTAVEVNMLAPMNLYQSFNVAYTQVKEGDDPNFANGYVEHEYMPGFINTLTSLRGEMILNSPIGDVSTWLGAELATRAYDGQNRLIRESKNYFSEDSRGESSVSIKTFRRRYDYTGASYNPPSALQFDPFDVSAYEFTSRWIHLDSTRVTEFNPDQNNSLSSCTRYIYGNASTTQATRIETTNSEGELMAVEKKFPADLAAPGNIFNTLVQQNNLLPAIEERGYRNGTQLSFSRNEMTYVNGNTALIAPAYTQVQKGSLPAETRIRFHRYDDSGNPLELSRENDVRVSYIWGYNRELPIAEAKGASWNDIAYTSFEDDAMGNWSVTATLAEGEGMTGPIACQLGTGVVMNQLISPERHLNYLVSYWAKNGTAVVNGQAGTAVTVKNGWTFYEHRLTDPASITIGGTALIDELRLCPVNAEMTSYTYIQGLGIATVSDNRGRLLYYEYDGFNRLLRIRDTENNIVKQMAYKYGASISPCANSNANWTATGLKRCLKDPQTNNNTGQEEGQERDLNNCSPTYWQTRWVSLGNTGNCPPVPNCSGEGKKIINGVCETGQRIFITQYYSGGQWHCSYYYQWSDGSTSTQYNTTGSICEIIES